MLEVNIRLVIAFLLFVSAFLIERELKADEEIKIFADQVETDENSGKIKAEGNAIVTVDQEMKIKSEKLTYNKEDKTLDAEGNIVINDKYKNTFFLKEFSSKENLKQFEGEQIKVRMNDDSRIVGSNIIKEDEISIINDAEYTPCKKNNYLINNCPGWKLKSKRIYHDNINKTIYYDHARIHLFNVPIFYTPYFAHPDPSVSKRTGLLMPSIQSDNQLGNTFSLPFFLNIKSNQDLTFTPTIQSKSNNFYSLNYRFLDDSIKLDIDASIDDNNDKSGTSNHLFFNSEIINEFGNLYAYLKSTNNDTYMRKNKINNLTVLKSGIDYSSESNNKFLSLEAAGYRHLTEQVDTNWEYLYPKVIYNIDNIDSQMEEGVFSLKNQFSVRKNLSESYVTLASSQVDWNNQRVHNKTGVVTNSDANFRVVSISIDEKSSDDINNIRVYPQISSKLSYPLLKNSKSLNQTLTPILMPIIAPYNNYTGSKTVTNSNIFSTNRATSITEWESGPRINYGIEWFVNFNKGLDAKFIFGQNYKFNKKSKRSDEEISDYFINSNMSFNPNNYLNSSLIVDRDDLKIKSLNANTFNELGEVIFAIDYDYTSEKYDLSREQLAVALKYNFEKDLFFKFTGSKNLDTNKNIGYQYGLLYENDCLGIDFNYYRDLTKDRDIEESDGFSFTIVLKPFGTANNYGKSKLFGPRI